MKDKIENFVEINGNNGETMKIIGTNSNIAGNCPVKKPVKLLNLVDGSETVDTLHTSAFNEGVRFVYKLFLFH